MSRNQKPAGTRFSQRAAVARSFIRHNGWFFAPGVLFVVLGCMVLIAPQFLLALGAVFFLLVGVLLVFAGWKLMQLKRKVEAIAKNIEGRISVQTLQVRAPVDQFSVPREEQQKKIILH